MLIPISFKYLLIDVDRNPDPLSECIVLGVPKVANNSWYIFIAVLDEVSLQANAQGNLLNSSTIVNMYLFFEVFDFGKGPLKSTAILSKGCVARINFPGLGL